MFISHLDMLTFVRCLFMSFAIKKWAACLSLLDLRGENIISHAGSSFMSLIIFFLRIFVTLSAFPSWLVNSHVGNLCLTPNLENILLHFLLEDL